MDELALGAGNVSISIETGSSYSLSVDSDDLGVKEDDTWWVVSGTTASLVSGSSEGWAADDGKIVYTPSNATATLAVVTGLASGGVVAKDAELGSVIRFKDKTTGKYVTGLSVNDEKIIVDKGALGTGTLEVATKVTGDDATTYSLELGTTIEADDKSSETPKGWSADTAGTAVYTVTSTAGYKEVANSSGAVTKISYVKAGDVETKISNLSTKLVKSSAVSDDKIDGITLEEGNVIKIAEKLLNKKTVSIDKKSDYTLEVDPNEDTDSEFRAPGNPVWTKKENDTKAIYARTTEAGYSLSSDGKSIVYSTKPTTETLATLSGLKKELTVDSDAFTEGIEIAEAEGETYPAITIKRKDILAGTKVTLGSKDNYVLKLGGEDVKWESSEDIEEPYWVVSNGTAILYGGLFREGRDEQ